MKKEDREQAVKPGDGAEFQFECWAKNAEKLRKDLQERRATLVREQERNKTNLTQVELMLTRLDAFEGKEGK